MRPLRAVRGYAGVPGCAAPSTEWRRRAQPIPHLVAIHGAEIGPGDQTLRPQRLPPAQPRPPSLQAHEQSQMRLGTAIQTRPNACPAVWPRRDRSSEPYGVRESNGRVRYANMYRDPKAAAAPAWSAERKRLQPQATAWRIEHPPRARSAE